MDEYMRGRSYEPLLALLEEIEHNLTIDNYRELFGRLGEEYVLPNIQKTEAFFATKKMTDIPKPLEQKLSKMVENNNRK